MSTASTEGLFDVQFIFSSKKQILVQLSPFALQEHNSVEANYVLLLWPHFMRLETFRRN